MHHAYAVFFEGQGGAITSPGILAMANNASTAGILTNFLGYEKYTVGLDALRRHRALGWKTAAIGYSLGADTVTLISHFVKLDLLIAIDPSLSAIAYSLYKPNVARSVLFHNNDWLAHLTRIGGADKINFDVRHEINVNHLLVDIDPGIREIVHQELVRLTV